MNDNNQFTEAQNLWVEIALCNKRIAEEAAKIASIMVRLGEIMVEE